MKNIRKKIELYEQKKILVEMLKYIDDLCKKNKINYTLIGGSLIGAVRNSGIIPWDDDIDIILFDDEYDKLKKVLKNEKRYNFFDPNVRDNYYYPFAKLTDSRTILVEKGLKKINDYGIYIDIFQYHYVSNSKLIRYIQYRFLMIIKILLGLCVMEEKTESIKNNVFKNSIYRLANLIGIERLKRIYLKLCKSKKKTKYVLSNWPVYGMKKEIQLSKCFLEYKTVKFENINAMIVKNYDEVLRTTFGDYMKLPPEEKRVSHHITEVYWKD